MHPPHKLVNVNQALAVLQKDNNVILNTMLDVLIDIHLDGKTQAQREAYTKVIAERLHNYQKEALDKLEGQRENPV